MWYWYFILHFQQDATGGRGADVIVEMLASASLSNDLKLVANKGCIAVWLSYANIIVQVALLILRGTLILHYFFFCQLHSEHWSMTVSKDWLAFLVSTINLINIKIKKVMIKLQVCYMYKAWAGAHSVFMGVYIRYCIFRLLAAEEQLKLIQEKLWLRNPALLVFSYLELVR